ncbi:MAG: YceD family protein [Bacteroidota bacterium]
MGLKVGKHLFEYEVTDSFFDDLEFSLVQKGSLQVRLELEKKETMLIARFWVEGTVLTDCDRCTGALELEIKGDCRLIYKFGHGESEDETLMIIDPDEYQVNVKMPIYELIILSIPSRKIHPEGQCDEEMWKLVKAYTVNTDDEEEDFGPDEDWEDEDEDWEDEGDDPDDEDDDGSAWSILKNLN